MNGIRSTASRRLVNLVNRATSALILAAVAFGGLFAAPALLAQRYPVKPIRIVVPFAPAGIADMLGRSIGQKLTESWHQQVVVENRGGAGGNIGMEFVARSAADGYTLALGNLGTLAINPSLYRNIPFDSVKDFVPIALVAGTPLLLVVHPSVPVNSVRELIAFARARPGQLNYASAGTGGPTHLAGELFRSMTATDIVHIPYRGNIAALTDVVAGEAHMMFTNLLTPLPFIRSGRLHALAVTSRKRQPAMPHTPTVAEAGVPGFDVSGWYGVLAPAGTPREIIARLNGEIVRIMQQRDIQEKFVRQGIEIFTSTPDQFATHIRAESARWGEVVRKSGARVD